MTDNYILEDGSGVLLLENLDRYKQDIPLKVINNNIGVTESENKVKGITITNTVGLSDVSNIAKGFAKNIASTLGLVFSKNRKTRNQNFLLEDNSNDALMLEDGSGLYLIDVLLANINENVGVTESSNKVLGLLKQIAETIEFTDSTNYVKGFVKVATQFIVSVESTINKLLTEVNTYLLEDSSGRYQTEEDTDLYLLDQLLIIRVKDEIVELTSAIDNYLGPIKQIADTILLTETSNRAMVMLRNITTNTLGLIETNNRLSDLVRNISNTLGLTETINRLGVIKRNIASTVGLTEASNKIRGRLKNIADTVGITEASNIITGIVKVIADTIGLTEAINRIRIVFISNNLGDFVVVDSINLEIFTSTDSYTNGDMTVIDSYNFDSFIIVDDN
jgi:uncharacterized protein Yka (UPF0111/DUF47 family)